MNKTTPAHYKLFKKEFMKWYDRFSLHHITIYFVHETEDDSLAWCAFHLVGQAATVGLSRDWPNYPTNALIKATAFHEAMETFLGAIRCYASDRFAKPEVLDAEFHRIINTIEHVAYK